VPTYQQAAPGGQFGHPGAQPAYQSAAQRTVRPADLDDDDVDVPSFMKR
jgi:hypothetical protein